MNLFSEKDSRRNNSWPLHHNNVHKFLSKHCTNIITQGTLLIILIQSIEKITLKNAFRHHFDIIKQKLLQELKNFQDWIKRLQVRIAS